MLVVDDNKDIVWLIESALSGQFRVSTCHDVAEALARLGEMTPDLIITDIVMAGASGLELVNAVRSDKFLRGIPVVVVSAKITESEQVEGLVSGADAYLTKPFSVPVLCATVERLIASRRMLKDYYNTPESVYTVVEGQKMHQTDKLFMDTVVDTIQEHIESENLRMELIAERLGLTARNFYRKFKKISGRTPSEFIKEYRFEYAARPADDHPPHHSGDHVPRGDFEQVLFLPRIPEEIRAQTQGIPYEAVVCTGSGKVS